MERSTRVTYTAVLSKVFGQRLLQRCCAREGVGDGHARGDGQRPTIYDVAYLPVSRNHLSRWSFRGPRGQRAAPGSRAGGDHRIGYRPNRAATVLASHRTKNVEVVIDDYRNLSFVGLLVGMQFRAGQPRLPPDGHRRRSSTPASAPRAAGSVLSTNLDGLIIAAEPDDALLVGWTGPPSSPAGGPPFPPVPIWSPTTTNWVAGSPPTTCCSWVTAGSVTSPAPSGPAATAGRASSTGCCRPDSSRGDR